MNKIRRLLLRCPKEIKEKEILESQGYSSSGATYDGVHAFYSGNPNPLSKRWKRIVRLFYRISLR